MSASSIASDDSTDDLVPHEVSPSIGRSNRVQGAAPPEFHLADSAVQPPRPSSRKRAEPSGGTSGTSGKRLVRGAHPSLSPWTQMKELRHRVQLNTFLHLPIAR